MSTYKKILMKLTLQVWQKLADGGFGTDTENDSFKAVDSIDLEVDFFSLHLLLQEGKGVDRFDHF